MCYTGKCPYESGYYGDCCSVTKDEKGNIPSDAWCSDGEESNENCKESQEVL